MTTTIAIRIRDQYGSPVAHPTNQAAQILAAIAGTKTLTLRTLDHAAALGLTITVATNDTSDWRSAFSA